MHVDESGSISHKDNTKYYVLSGVIVNNDEIYNLKQISYKYKLSNFIRDYVDAEIHTHDIFKSRGDFTRISLEEKYHLLDELYAAISKMDIIIISIVIDKHEIQERNPSWKILDNAWLYLFERFDNYLECISNSAEGIIKIDKSTPKQQSEVYKIIRFLRNRTADCQKTRINTDPVFIDSASAEGIQIADAIAYCTFSHKSNSAKFESYWKMIYHKFRRDRHGHVNDYGIKEFPNKRSVDR